MLAWQKKSTSDAFVARFRQTQQLAQYGIECLHLISLDAGIVPEQAQGQLALFSSEAALAAIQPKLDLLKEIGVSLCPMDRAQAQKIEPALDTEYPLHAAIHFPNDEIANCRQFAHMLKDRALELDVQFHFGATLLALRAGTPVHLEFAQMPQAQSFDRVVLCTGTGSSAIAGAGNGRLPLTELHSHSISVPIREALNAPRSAIFDYERATSIGRLGTRLRVSGGTELGGTAGKVRPQTTKQLFNTLQTRFPGAASYQNGTQIWKGRIAFTPDALPLVGPTTAPGVWLNLGHGQNGWSMCCATARIAADMLSARAPALDPACLLPSRFHL
jgi:D-amino-acid dehydrogenase